MTTERQADERSSMAQMESFPDRSLSMWAIALVVSMVPLVGAEVFLRSYGYLPQVVDDSDLWCSQRDLVIGAGPEHLVLVGSSRIRLAFSLDTFRQLTPELEVTQLAIDGSSFLPTLHDLARDPSFSGTVLVGVAEVWFLPRYYPRQQAFVDYCYERWGTSRKLDGLVSWWLQERLLIAQPGLSFEALVDRWEAQLANGQSPSMPGRIYVIPRRDRSAAARFDLVDVERLRLAAIESRLEFRQEFREEQLTPGRWLAWAAYVETLVQMIQGRGGRVVMVRLPTTGEWWELDRSDFPREQYWDRFAAATTATTIHFEDVPALNEFELPDTSHLDVSDQDSFTRALVNELLCRRSLATARPPMTPETCALPGAGSRLRSVP